VRRWSVSHRLDRHRRYFEAGRAEERRQLDRRRVLVPIRLCPPALHVQLDVIGSWSGIRESFLIMDYAGINREIMVRGIRHTDGQLEAVDVAVNLRARVT
jgi:hypothetical protein